MLEFSSSDQIDHALCQTGRPLCQPILEHPVSVNARSPRGSHDPKIGQDWNLVGCGHGILRVEIAVSSPESEGER